MVFLLAESFLMTACLLSVLLGGWLLRNPVRAIELQQRFYLKINWRMTPVSMKKEISNTRWMGGFLIFVAVIVFVSSFF